MRTLITLAILATTAHADEFALKNAELDVQAREADYAVARIQVDMAKVQLEYQERQFARIRKLAEQNAVGQDQVSKVETEFMLARLKVDLRKAMADRAQVEVHRARLKLEALRNQKKQ